MILVQNYYEKSENAELCKKLYEEAIAFFSDKHYTLDEEQEEALLNHLCEMIQRANAQRPIHIEDKTIFNDLSKESLNQAKKIVSQIKNLPEDEVFLLAIHFEIVRYTVK